MSQAFGGGVYIADTSAWVRNDHPAVMTDWQVATDSQQLIATPILAFEVLCFARDRREFDRIEQELSVLPEARVDHSVMTAARSALREMVRFGQHRMPFPDVLVAAAAQARGVGVLHYDGHFDRLARFLSFESRWIAPAGSL